MGDTDELYESGQRENPGPSTSTGSQRNSETFVDKLNGFKYKKEGKPDTSNISFSCILQEIGYQILQDNVVQKKYQFVEGRRQITKLVNLDSDPTDQQETGPGSYLARLLNIRKLDRDLMGNTISELKEKGTVGGKGVITSNGWKIIVYSNDQCNYYHPEVGKYSCMAQVWEQQKHDIDPSEIKTILQSYFKGQEISHEGRIFLTKWEPHIELMFGIEVIRNSSTLLTHPMFFDLVNKGKYTLDELERRLPVAMQGAVAASFAITEKMERSFYDCRRNMYDNDAMARLAKRDEIILYDWLEQKIMEKMNLNLLSRLDREDNLSKLQTFQNGDENLNFIKLTECDPNAPIRHEESIIPFQLDYYSGKLRLEWVEEENCKRFHFKICQIGEVSAKVFYDLIFEWYGIEVQELNNENEKLKLDLSLESRGHSNITSAH